MKYNFKISETVFSQRLERWDTWWAVRQEGMSKSINAVTEAQKAWYLHGDLDSLLELPDSADKYTALGLISTVSMCPAQNVKDLYSFVEHHSLWLSENGLDFWSDNLQASRDEMFLSFLFDRAFGNNLDLSSNVLGKFIQIFCKAHEGTVEFPIKLGIDSWQPSFHIDMQETSWKYFHDTCCMLFNEDGLEYSHLKEGLSLLEFLPSCNPKIFQVSFLEEGSEETGNTKLVANSITQEMTRLALGGLLGLKNDYHEYDGSLRHNDPGFEEAFREKLLSLSMPQQFFELIEFIKRHPDDYAYRDGD